MKIIFATGNENKMREVREILGTSYEEIISMKEAGITSEAEENGSSFAENALIKARDVASRIKGSDAVIVLADDSGLEVDAMNGEPGIRSSRFMGEDTPYTVKNHAIIDRLNASPEKPRTARFRCVIAAVLPDGREYTTDGVIEGTIGFEEKGSRGFGYDPIFIPLGSTRSTAELSAEEKNAVSHRGNALRAMKSLLKKEL